jgi:hypothetical protein
MAAQPSDSDPDDETRQATRLVLDLELDRLPNDRAREASRILRYWAGALLQMDLTQPTEQALMDSNYQAVGSLRLLATRATDEPETSP